MHGIASVASHLHSRGLMHGDLYAHNLMIDRSSLQPALLCDFGAATFYRASGQNFESVEVRAWGILADELLSMKINEGETYLGSSLKLLVLQCISEDVSQRPSFSFISQQLSEMISKRGKHVAFLPAYYIAGSLVLLAACTLVLFTFTRGHRKTW